MNFKHLTLMGLWTVSSLTSCQRQSYKTSQTWLAYEKQRENRLLYQKDADFEADRIIAITQAKLANAKTTIDTTNILAKTMEEYRCFAEVVSTPATKILRIESNGKDAKGVHGYASWGFYTNHKGQVSRNTKPFYQENRQFSRGKAPY